MDFQAAKCPSCNGELRIPDDRDIIKCMYCGLDIKVRDVINVVQQILPNLQLMKMEAMKAFSDNHYKDSEDLCDKILVFEPNNSEIILLRAKSSFMYRGYQYLLEDVFRKPYHLYPPANDTSNNLIRNYFKKAIEYSFDKVTIRKEINDFLFNSLLSVEKYFMDDFKESYNKLINCTGDNLYIATEVRKKFSIMIPFFRIIISFYEFALSVLYDKRCCERILFICSFATNGFKYEVKTKKFLGIKRETVLFNVYNSGFNRDLQYSKYFESKYEEYKTQL